MATSTTTTIPLASQVGGHSGVQTTEDGSLIIKPALALEHKFYQSVTTDPGFAALRPFVPKFFGTLKLEGQTDGGGELKDIPGVVQKESLVLENLSHKFLKPNILDVKLGTELYDEEASPDKVARMIKTAKETTSFESGVRLTGFQVYDNFTGVAVNTPKSYGKSIAVAQLPEGIARFFPVPNAPAESTSGLPAPLLLRILKYVKEDIEEVKAAFAGIEMRMVGGSVLVIYEGDEGRATQALEAFEHDAEKEEMEDDDAESDEDEEEAANKPGPPYLVKMIDFAHTRLVPGQGPDKGVLKGFETLISLLDGRIKELSA